MLYQVQMTHLLSTMGGMLGSNLIKYNIFNKNYEKHRFNYFENFNNFGRIDKNPIYNNTIDEKEIKLGRFSKFKNTFTPNIK